MSAAEAPVAAVTGAPPAAGARGSGIPAELGWAAGSVGTAALFNVVALLALFFMTTFLGIAPAVAGLLIFISKLYDGIIDPLIGAVSDRTRHRWGPRRIFLLVSGIGLGIVFALFFGQPAMGGTASVVISFVILLLFSTAYSGFGVPYLAITPDLARDYDSRTRLMTFRVFFMMLGVMIGSAGAPLIIQAAGGGIAGYRMIGLAFGALTILTCLIAFFSTARVPYGAPTGPEQAPKLGATLFGAWRDLASVWGNAPFRLLTLVKLCQLAVLSTVQACTPFFFAFVLRVPPGDIAKYLIASTVAGLIFLPVIRWVIRRVGKREANLTVLLLHALGLASWFLWTPGEPIFFFYLRAVLIGIVSIAGLLCVLAMLPDTMEYDRLTSGQERAGVISGAFTLVENLAGACGPLVVGILLQSSGLIQGSDPTLVQPPAAILAIHLGVSIVPAVFALMAFGFMLAYRLNPEILAAARQRTAAPQAE
jgi:Na+/melibiose symporter-like transporter